MKADFERECERVEQQCAAENRRPRLLLHACCAPCASAVAERLREVFDLTLYFCNPNIEPQEEYEKRRDALVRLGEILRIPVIDGSFSPDLFCRQAKEANVTEAPEGGARCALCFRIRLSKTADFAAQNRFDWFCTTLTVSPHKNATLLNEIGASEAARVGVPFLPSDFKKKGGYLRSVQLSREWDLYRQNYCGCRYSFR